MIFESHAHYDDEAFDTDRTLLLEELPRKNIGHVINVSSDYDSLSSTAALSEKYSYIYAAFGIHPDGIPEMDEEKFEDLRNFCSRAKCVAIGEIGLDYHWPEPGREIQKGWFVRQLHLSKEKNLPVIIHSRDAAKDTLDIMKREHAGSTGGVIHCFSYTRETAKEFLEMGYSFGIGGVVTFTNAKKMKEAVEYIPIDRILVETDSPYLAPVPNRGKRNSSLNLPYIIEKIAEIKGMSAKEVEEITEKNAVELFGIRD